MTEVTTRLVGIDEFADLEMLFGRSPVLSGCWCIWPYTSRGGFAPSAEHRAEMESRVSEGERPGVLAWLNGSPVGWCALGPAAQYPRYRSVECEALSWAVACIYVAPAARGQGVTTALLDRAAETAAAAGATSLYGPPPWWDAGGADACSVAATTFEEHGFVRVAAGARMPVLRRDLGT